jgi:hypothetical protein
MVIDPAQIEPLPRTENHCSFLGHSVAKCDCFRFQFCSVFDALSPIYGLKGELSDYVGGKAGDDLNQGLFVEALEPNDSP